MSFSGLEIAKKALFANQHAINVTGHNIANANTEGYSRQRVIMTASSPLYSPHVNSPVVAGQKGTGVLISEVNRIRDAFIDNRVWNESSALGRWDKQEELMHQLELIYNEPSESSLRSVMDQFWAALSDLANNPEEEAVRSLVREKAEGLTGTVNHMYNQLQALGGSGGVGGGNNAINSEIESVVAEINGWAKQIAALNVQIKNIQAGGNNPNDLLDKRDYYLTKINEYIKISTTDSGLPDEFRVIVGGMVLVQGSNSHELTFRKDTLDNKKYIYFEDGSVKAQMNDGSLKALFYMRDEIMPEHFDKLNEFAITFTQMFNEIHKTGFGIDGSTDVDFFKEVDGMPTGVYKITSNPEMMPPTNSYVMDTSVPLNGGTSPGEIINYEGNSITGGKININGYLIDYDADNDSLEDIVKRINDANSGVTAHINPENKLVLTALRENDYEIKFLDDTGDLLSRLGILDAGTQYDGTVYTESNFTDITSVKRPPKTDFAAKMAVSKDIINSLSRIAAAGGIDTNLDGVFDTSKGPGDNSNSLKLSGLKDEKILTNKTSTFNDFYNGIISKVATNSQVAKVNADNQNDLITNLKNIQESISGVNLDEEMTNLLKFQRAYSAAAKVINAMDEMLNVLIGLGR